MSFVLRRSSICPCMREKVNKQVDYSHLCMHMLILYQSACRNKIIAYLCYDKKWRDIQVPESYLSLHVMYEHYLFNYLCKERHRGEILLGIPKSLLEKIKDVGGTI